MSGGRLMLTVTVEEYPQGTLLVYVHAGQDEPQPCGEVPAGRSWERRVLGLATDAVREGRTAYPTHSAVSFAEEAPFKKRPPPRERPRRVGEGA